MKLEIKTIRKILNESIEGKVEITMTDWLIDNQEKKWVSVESLVTRLETDFFNPENQLVGKSPEYIIGYFLDKIMKLQKELEEKK